MEQLLPRLGRIDRDVLLLLTAMSQLTSLILQPVWPAKLRAQRSSPLQSVVHCSLVADDAVNHARQIVSIFCSYSAARCHGNRRRDSEDGVSNSRSLVSTGSASRR